MEEINVFEKLFEDLHDEKQKKAIFNFDEFETSIFYIYYYEKINTKFYLDDRNSLTRLILIFGFLIFCVNNNLNILEKKVLVLLDYFYPDRKDMDKIDEIPVRGIFKKSLLKIYEAYYNIENKKIQLELKKFDFDQTLFIDQDYYYDYVLPEYPDCKKNDLILNIEEFLVSVLNESFLKILNELWQFKIRSNSERDELRANEAYDKVIDWTLSYLKADNNSKFINRDKFEDLLTKIESTIKNPFNVFLDDNKNDLPF